jgi:hypothetical protein
VYKNEHLIMLPLGTSLSCDIMRPGLKDEVLLINETSIVQIGEETSLECKPFFSLFTTKHQILRTKAVKFEVRLDDMKKDDIFEGKQVKQLSSQHLTSIQHLIEQLGQLEIASVSPMVSVLEEPFWNGYGIWDFVKPIITITVIIVIIAALGAVIYFAFSCVKPWISFLAITKLCARDKKQKSSKKRKPKRDDDSRGSIQLEKLRSERIIRPLTGTPPLEILRQQGRFL